MDKENKLKAYKKYIIFLVIVMVMYLFFAIGDVVIKGYSDLPAYGFTIPAVAIGVLIGLYLKERKSK